MVNLFSPHVDGAWNGVIKARSAEFTAVGLTEIVEVTNVEAGADITMAKKTKDRKEGKSSQKGRMRKGV